MSIKFDKKNGNLMEPSISNKKLKFISKTGETYDALPEETLIYSKEATDSSLSQYNNFLKNVLKDPTNPKKFKYCAKCKKTTIVVPIYVRNDLINTCSICDDRWIEGID